MGKTLRSIVSVGLSIAALVPGPQQPFVAGAALAFSVANAYLFTKAAKPQLASSAVKTEIPPRVSGYGRYRTFGAYILFDTASDGTAVDVWAFHDGRINNVLDYYLGDELVTVDGNGFVQKGEDGRWGDGDTIRVKVNRGLPTETAWAEVISKMGGIWTSNHRGDGVVTGFMLSKAVKAKNFQEVYPQGGPNQTPLAVLIEAQLVYDWRDNSQSLNDPSTWKWSENVILHLAHYQMVRNGKTWDRHFAPTLGYWTEAVNDCDRLIPLKGVQVVLTTTANVGATSINVSSVTDLLVGDDVIISSSANSTYTEPRFITGIAGNVLSFADPLSFVHPSGSMVNWQPSNAKAPAEPRYRSCLSHKHTDTHKEVIGALLSCCDGWMSPRQDGAIIVYSGRYYPPTVTISSDVVISYGWEDGVDEESALNEIPVSYVSAFHDYATVDTDPWVDEGDIATRGKILSDPLENQVPSHSQARRLAKRKMAQVMAAKRGTVTTNSRGEKAIGQRYIWLDLQEGIGTEYYTNPYTGPAEITQLSRNLQTGGVSFSWIAADPNVDAWNPATEEGDPAPVGERMAREPLEPPVISTATANYGAQSGADTAGVYIALTVDGPDRTDLIWYLRTRQQGATIWGEREYSDIDPNPTVALATEFVPADTMVEVEASYGVGDGRISPWSATEVVDTSTAGLAPEEVTGFAALGGTGNVKLSWNNPTSPSLSYERTYRSATATFGSAVQVGPSHMGGQGVAMTYTNTVAPGVYYFWVRTFNSSGIGSLPTGPVMATAT